VEDFLWFVLNPAYGMRRFRREHIWCTSRRVVDHAAGLLAVFRAGVRGVYGWGILEMKREKVG